MKAFSKKVAGDISLKTLLVTLFFIAAVFVFALLAHAIANNNEINIDANAFIFFKEHTTPAVIKAMQVITFFGSAWFFVPFYILLTGFLLIKKRKTEAINILILVISSSAAMFGIKQYFRRQRPQLPLLQSLTNYSFPSGHTLSSFIFCSVIIYLVWRGAIQKKIKWLLSILLLLVSILIGISRIVLRYHYATDVIAGFCLGFVWVIFSLWLERKITSEWIVQKLDN
jgi:membrane-associated phospholipid phosphatase